MENSELLFRVLIPASGHEYRIYTNGEVEGFGEGAAISNYYYDLLYWELFLRNALQELPKIISSETLAPAAVSPTSHLTGISHSSA